jgi:drug/metabolite transporter (DMT)-like permease
VLGDYFLFKSYEYISSKISMLMMNLAPPVAALLGWFMMSEPFSWLNIMGMSLVLGGVALVVLKKEKANGVKQMRYSVRGVLYALAGAVGQGVGAVFSKIGMGDYDPFAASQIRVITGLIGFIVMITLMRKWGSVLQGTKDRKSFTALSLGSFFGPFLGVSLGMVAFKYTSVGVASTLMATVPVFILAPTHFVFKEKLTLNEVLGALVAVVGIVLFFL